MHLLIFIICRLNSRRNVEVGIFLKITYIPVLYINNIQSWIQTLFSWKDFCSSGREGNGTLQSSSGKLHFLTIKTTKSPILRGVSLFWEGGGRSAKHEFNTDSITNSIIFNCSLILSQLQSKLKIPIINFCNFMFKCSLNISWLLWLNVLKFFPSAYKFPATIC